MAYKKKNTRAPIVDPPFEHHTQPEQISPTTAQQSIAKYLTRSESRPYMHPDSFLASSGIRFAIGSGPKGGIALHHLRRIEAGLRGEYLEKETPEQLEALFGDQWRARGDDYMLDGLIDESERRLRKKRKRKREEIEDWVSTSSSQAIADEILEEFNSQSLGYSKYHGQIESFANTPVRRADYDEIEESQYEDPYYYELNQRVWTKDPQSGEGGAVGTMVQQGGEVPGVVEHDREGNVVKETKQSRAEKKAAKRARKEAYKQQKIKLVRESKLVDADAVRELLETDRRNEEEDRKAEKAARKEERRKRKEEKETAKGSAEDEEERPKKRKRQEEKKGANGGVDDEDERQKKRKRKEEKKKERSKSDVDDEDKRQKTHEKKKVKHEKENEPKRTKEVKKESG